MNKTVNINLAGIFFHIDEDAYLKLQRYLEAIKRSFTDSQGRSEIIADIEARIAELFNERIENDRQVIRIKEVDEIITIMGQPEDYLVDDEIFEDGPKSSYKSSEPSKKLYRDTDNSYVGGVSSGLGHYFGIDAIWIRLAWIILVTAAGTGILLYILLWILVPEAKTTAEKIIMTGEPVNISNIEKKIRDGFDNVSETVGDVAKNVGDNLGSAAKNVSDSVSRAAKNVNVKKGADSIKSSSRTFFETLGDVFMFFLNIFAKFVGIILIMIGAITLIVLIIAMFSIGIVDIVHIPGLDLVEIANAGNTPFWLVSLLFFFAIGIPFFFLFYLGLKILINNLKSIGNIAKFTLLGLWLVSIIALIVVGIRQVSEHAFNETVSEKTELAITTNDTLNIKMVSNETFGSQFHRNQHGFKVDMDDSGNKIVYSSDIDVIVRSTSDSITSLAVEKKADGRNFEIARDRARNIDYEFEIRNNTLLLNSFLSTDADNKFSDQEVDVILYLPDNMVVKFDKNAQDYMYSGKYDGNIVTRYLVNYFLKIEDGEATCQDCPEEESFDVDIDVKDEDASLKINDEGIEIKSDSTEVSINGEGIKGKTESVKINLNSDGLSVKSNDN